MAIHEAAARGFPAGAEAYERGRPDYSPEAIERLVVKLSITPGSRVLDLAAGTGKLTRQLVATGADLVAVEPVAEMREQLARAVPSAEILDGTAERIPLPNHSVDAVVVGQAFHWFDGVRAVTEVHRVLRPTGALGLIWQARDASRPWVERLDAIIDRAASGEPRFKTGAWRHAFELTALFDPLEQAELDYLQPSSADAIVDRVASISYIAAMDESRRSQIIHEVRDLLATEPETASAEVIDLPYRAHIFWTRPRSIPVGPSSGVVGISPGRTRGAAS